MPEYYAAPARDYQIILLRQVFTLRRLPLVILRCC